MILKQDKDKIIRLNGEPLIEWFATRRIKPIRYAYVEKGDGGQRKMCLTAAMGYAACEKRCTYEVYKAILFSRTMPTIHDEVAVLLGEMESNIKRLEAGWMGLGFRVEIDCKIMALGWEAWRQMRQDSRPAWGEGTVEPYDPRHQMHSGE